MPSKLAKNKKLRKGQQAHATKVLANVNEVLTEYDVVDDGEIESEIDESDNFRAQIHEALVKLPSCQVAHDQQKNVQKQETRQEPKSSGNKPKLPKLTLNKFNGDPKRWQEWWDSSKEFVLSKEVQQGPSPDCSLLLLTTVRPWKFYEKDSLKNKSLSIHNR